MNLISSKKLIAYLRLWLTAFFIIAESAVVVIWVIYRIPALYICAGIFVLYLILFVWYVKSYVNHCSIELPCDKIIVSSGNLFRRKRIISDDSVIYYERRVGIVGRMFGICTLHLHLTHRTVTVFGLTAEAVEEIEDRIK